MRVPGRVLISCLVLTAALLGGCLSSSPKTVIWNQHKTSITSLNHWRIRSKLGYVTPTSKGSAWLDWEQIGEYGKAHISGPFGAGAAQVSSSASGAMLRQAGKTDLHAASAAELTHHLFGWQLPVEQLRYWVRGLPSPEMHTRSITTNPQGLLSHLEQEGWVLSFTGYRNTAVGPLPGKIEASSGNLQIRLLIKEWTVGTDVNDKTDQPVSKKI